MVFLKMQLAHQKEMLYFNIKCETKSWYIDVFNW